MAHPNRPKPPDQALHLALRFLAPRARSEAEITERLLRKGVTPSAAAEVLEKLRALGYAGDRNFAREWALSRARSRGYGPRRLEQELRAKGVDEPLIAGSLAEVFSGGQEKRQARAVLEKRFRDIASRDPKTLRRAALFLQRLGYSETVIYEVLQLDGD